jgi:hypothetical protein
MKAKTQNCVRRPIIGSFVVTVASEGSGLRRREQEKIANPGTS